MLVSSVHCESAKQDVRRGSYISIINFFAHRSWCLCHSAAKNMKGEVKAQWACTVGDPRVDRG